MKKLTKEHLKEVDACTAGYRWFTKNYPNGLVVSQKNIEKLFNQLAKRKGKFFNEYCGSMREDAYYALYYLIILPDKLSLLNDDDTPKQIAKAFVKDWSKQ